LEAGDDDPVSGEIDLPVEDPGGALTRIRRRYVPGARAVDETDGLSVAFEAWRFHARPGDGEPVVRLAVESRGDAALVRDKTGELLDELRRRT